MTFYAVRAELSFPFKTNVSPNPTAIKNAERKNMSCTEHGDTKPAAIGPSICPKEM